MSADQDAPVPTNAADYGRHREGNGVMAVSDELWQRFEKSLSRRDTTGLAVADAIDFGQRDVEVARRLAMYREAKQEVSRLLEEMDAQEATHTKKMPPAVAPAEGVEKPTNQEGVF